MDPAAILNSLVASGPVALVLFYWLLQERKDKRELQNLVIELAREAALTAKTVKGALAKQKKEVNE